MDQQHQQNLKLQRNRFYSYTTSDEFCEYSQKQNSLQNLQSLKKQVKHSRSKVLIAYFSISQNLRLVSVQDLRKIFIPFGPVSRLLIKQNQNNPNQVQCFIEFENATSIDLIYSLKIKHKNILQRAFLNDLGIVKIDKSRKHKKLFPKNFYQFWDLKNKKPVQQGQQKLTDIFQNCEKEQNLLNDNLMFQDLCQDSNQERSTKLLDGQVVVFIKNFNILQESEVCFMNFFGIFGDVDKIIYQPNKMQVFVQFDDHNGALNCVESLNNLKLNNYKIKAEFSYNKDQLYFDEQKSSKGQELNKNYSNEIHKKRFFNNYQQDFIPFSRTLIVQSSYTKHVNPKYVLETLRLYCKDFQVLKQTEKDDI